MSSPRVRVTRATGVQSLQNQRGYRNTIGHFITKRFKGTETECGIALNTLISNGGVIDASIEEDAGGYFILSVNYSAESATATGGTADPASVITQWSREQSRTEKSLWFTTPWRTLSDSIATTYGITSAVGLRIAIEDYLSGQATIDTLSTVLTSYGLSLNNETISQLVDHFRKGIEVYPVQQWVFRRTQTGPLQYLQNDDATILKVWSRASFAAQSTMRSDFLVRVPSAGYFLQGGAVLTQVDDFKWQSVQDWDYAEEFSTWIYGNAI